MKVVYHEMCNLMQKNNIVDVTQPHLQQNYE